MVGLTSACTAGTAAQPKDPAAKLLRFPDAAYVPAMRACFDVFGRVQPQLTISVTTAGKVAAYLRAKGMDWRPWSTLPAQRQVDVCGHVVPLDDPCNAASGSKLPDVVPLIRVATDGSDTHTSYPDGKWPVSNGYVCVSSGNDRGSALPGIIDP